MVIPHLKSGFGTVIVSGWAFALSCWACYASDGGITPSSGEILNARHVLFTFPENAGATRYQLQVAADNGEEDPYADGMVFDDTSRRARRIVKYGLEFGGAYVWQVRGLDQNGTPGPWYVNGNFSIEDIPNYLLDQVTLEHAEPERMQPGVTLTMLGWVTGAPDFYSVAFNELGEYIWFEEIGLCDVRMLRNGNILGAFEGELREITLAGETVWSFTNPRVDHHEAFDMPNGNVMHLRDTFREVERNGDVQQWKGQQIFEVDRNGTVVWQWNPFDHLSTLDFDPCIMELPGSDGYYDWTHANAATYDAVENVVYYSPRHLSRIVKIDYATGNVIWNFGLDMPSGEVDFPGEYFSFQHAPEVLTNGHLLVYDNGNRRDDPTGCSPADFYSSAIEFKIDPEADEPVTEVWRFDHIYSSFVSDADRLPNGNTLVDAGGRAIIYEVTPDGTVVWQLDAVPGPAFMYRADRIPSLYPLAGDADGDDDVDLLDFGAFQACFAGENDTAIHRSCLKHDLNVDGMITVRDYQFFVSTFTGDGP